MHTDATMTRRQWAEEFLSYIHAPVTVRNMRALIAWLSAEGTTARWNPLATTKHMPGSTSFNWAGVQNYPDPHTGLRATYLTLREPGHGYEKILRRLHNNRWASYTLRAVRDSEWGTGALALQILPSVKNNLDAYGNKPIGTT